MLINSIEQNAKERPERTWLTLAIWYARDPGYILRVQKPTQGSCVPRIVFAVCLFID